jgi:hypothetical protein
LQHTDVLAEQNWSAVQTAFYTEHPIHFAVVDGFLTPAALEQFREGLLRDQRWHYKHPDSNELYLKAPGGPVFAAIAEGMKDRLPNVLGGLDMVYHWAYLHTRSVGLSTHTDAGLVTLNLYLTPDKYNQEPGTGGLVLTTARRPPSVSLVEYNSEPWATQYFQREHSDDEFVVEYRCNRLIIFDSRIYHRSDRIRFGGDGTRAMRTNVGVLFAELATYASNGEIFASRLERADQLAKRDGIDLPSSSLDVAEDYWYQAGG